MEGLRIVLLCVMAAGLSHGNRDPKFFLVSSTTTTTVSTTTSVLSTLSTCFYADMATLSNDATVGCPSSRKRKSLRISDENVLTSKITRKTDDYIAAEIIPTNDDNVSNRKGKFFWYYMTTTTTTTSTSTSTSTSYTGFYSITLTGCTPTIQVNYCG